MDRAAPTSTISRKNSTNASAVQSAPSPTRASTASTGGQACGPVTSTTGAYDERRDAEAGGGQRDRGDVTQRPVRDDRRGRVPEGREQHLGDGPRVPAGRARPEQQRRRRRGRRAGRPSARAPRDGGRPPAGRGSPRRSARSRRAVRWSSWTACARRSTAGSTAATISSTANPSTAGQWPRSTRRPPPRSAKGRSSRAPSAVRTNTTMTGVTSVTAILISRYGMPQMTPTATRRIQPRRLTRAPRRERERMTPP